MTTAQPYSTTDAARELLRDHLKYFLYVWAALFVITAGAALVIATVNEVNNSILGYVQNPTRYWFLVAGIILVTACLRVYVAHGVTRRSFTLGGLTAGATVAATMAAVMAAGFFAEHVSYRALGWSHGFGDSTSFGFTSGTQAPTIFAEYTLVYSAHFMAGFAIGALYMSRHWIIATVLSLAAYAGAAAAESVLAVGWPGEVMAALDVAPLQYGLSLAAAAAVVVALAATCWALARRMSICAPGPKNA